MRFLFLIFDFFCLKPELFEKNLLELALMAVESVCQERGEIDNLGTLPIQAVLLHEWTEDNLELLSNIVEKLPAPMLSEYGGQVLLQLMENFAFEMNLDDLRDCSKEICKTAQKIANNLTIEAKHFCFNSLPEQISTILFEKFIELGEDGQFRFKDDNLPQTD